MNEEDIARVIKNWVEDGEMPKDKAEAVKDNILKKLCPSYSPKKTNNAQD